MDDVNHDADDLSDVDLGVELSIHAFDLEDIILEHVGRAPEPAAVPVRGWSSEQIEAARLDSISDASRATRALRGRVNWGHTDD